MLLQFYHKITDVTTDGQDMPTKCKNNAEKSFGQTQTWKKGKTALGGIFGLLGNLEAYITTNQRVITKIPNSAVPRMEKFIKELISLF